MGGVRGTGSTGMHCLGVEKRAREALGDSFFVVDGYMKAKARMYVRDLCAR